MRKIPRTLASQDALDWVPVDSAASSILDVVISRVTDKGAADLALDCFHIVNPQVADWKSLVHVIPDFYERHHGSSIEPVEFTDWLDELKNIEMTPEQIERHPSIKLLDFFEAMSQTQLRKVKFATKHTVEYSRTMSELRAVDEVLMKSWLEQWGF